MRKLYVKLVAVLIVTFMGVGLMAGCGNSAASKENTLYIYNWSEYIPQEVYEMFEEETGIHVVESTFSSNEEMLAKLVAGGTGEYDIFVASNYVIPAMIAQGLIKEIDTSKIENMANISEDNLNLGFDKGNKYTVPYMATITLIVMNQAKCAELGVEINNLNDLLNPALTNNIVVPDDCRELVDVALKALNLDPDSTDEAVIEQASDWLIELSKNVKLYDSDTPFSALATNEVAVGLVYNMDAVKAAAINSDIVLVDVPEGNEMSYDSFVMSAKTEKDDLVYQFINFIHRPEIYKMCYDEYPCVCLNKGTMDLMGDDYYNNPLKNISSSIFAKAHVIGDVGDAATYYDNVFSKMKN